MSSRTKIIIAALAIPAIGLGWWLGSPLFLDRTVDEAFPVTQPVAAEASTSTTTAPEAASESPTTSTSSTVPETPMEPVVLAAGSFLGADDFHEGSGTATLYELEDGTRVLRFEDFSVTNGPDLRVLLVPSSDPVNDGIGGYLELEALKGNVGSQNYEIPPDVDLSAYGSVVIYCKPFHVLFAVAALDA